MKCFTYSKCKNTLLHENINKSIYNKIKKSGGGKETQSREERGKGSATREEAMSSYEFIFCYKKLSLSKKLGL